MKIKVSNLIVRYLKRVFFEYILGIPGAHILPVYNSLYNSKIQSVLAKHEQGVRFMNEGWALTDVTETSTTKRLIIFHPVHR
ncbi:MAG: thiamine pyrophosphate-binding protein [Gammaproteobacteria bacterium]|nr:thiamine pyrophosphate-binding protein [Gammaproteobacteria bacterium]